MEENLNKLLLTLADLVEEMREQRTGDAVEADRGDAFMTPEMIKKQEQEEQAQRIAEATSEQQEKDRKKEQPPPRRIRADVMPINIVSIDKKVLKSLAQIMPTMSILKEKKQDQEPTPGPSMLSMLGAGALGLVVAPFVTFYEMVSSILKAPWFVKFSKWAKTKFWKPIEKFGTRISNFFKNIGDKITPISEKFKNTFKDLRKRFPLLDSTIRKLDKGFTSFTDMVKKFLAPIFGDKTKPSLFTRIKDVMMKNPVFKSIIKFSRNVGKFLGKLFLPVTIVWGIIDAIMNFSEGYDQDGVVGGISTALSGVFDFLVGDILKFLISIPVAILDWIGLDQTAKSIEASTSGMIDSVSKAIGDLVYLIKGVFTLDGDLILEKSKELFKGFVDFAAFAIGTFVDPVVNIFKDVFKVGDSESPFSFKTDIVDPAIAQVKKVFNSIAEFDYAASFDELGEFFSELFDFESHMNKMRDKLHTEFPKLAEFMGIESSVEREDRANRQEVARAKEMAMSGAVGDMIGQEAAARLARELRWSKIQDDTARQAKAMELARTSTISALGNDYRNPEYIPRLQKALESLSSTNTETSSAIKKAINTQIQAAKKVRKQQEADAAKLADEFRKQMEAYDRGETYVIPPPVVNVTPPETKVQPRTLEQNKQLLEAIGRMKPKYYPDSPQIQPTPPPVIKITSDPIIVPQAPVVDSEIVDSIGKISIRPIIQNNIDPPIIQISDQTPTLNTPPLEISPRTRAVLDNAPALSPAQMEQLKQSLKTPTTLEKPTEQIIKIAPVLETTPGLSPDAAESNRQMIEALNNIPPLKRQLESPVSTAEPTIKPEIKQSFDPVINIETQSKAATETSSRISPVIEKSVEMIEPVMKITNDPPVINVDTPALNPVINITPPKIENLPDTTRIQPLELWNFSPGLIEQVNKVTPVETSNFQPKTLEQNKQILDVLSRIPDMSQPLAPKPEPVPIINPNDVGTDTWKKFEIIPEQRTNETTPHVEPTENTQSTSRVNDELNKKVDKMITIMSESSAIQTKTLNTLQEHGLIDKQGDTVVNNGGNSTNVTNITLESDIIAQRDKISRRINL